VSAVTVSPKCKGKNVDPAKEITGKRIKKGDELAPEDLTSKPIKTESAINDAIAVDRVGDSELKIA
jgi:hypothetical protein